MKWVAKVYSQLRSFKQAVYNCWTGLVDWTGGLNWMKKNVVIITIMNGYNHYRFIYKSTCSR